VGIELAMAARGLQLRVATVGMDERMQNALRVFFKVQCRNQCVLADEDSAHIGLVDLDGLQAGEGWASYRQRFPGRPTVVISLKAVETTDAVFLQKPLKPEQLRAALQRLQSAVAATPAPHTASQAECSTDDTREPKTPGVPAAPQDTVKDESVDRHPQTFGAASALADHGLTVSIGTAPDINPGISEDVARAQYRPEQFLPAFLSHALDLAAREDKWVRVEAPGGDIIVLPGGERVQVKSANSLSLRSLCSLPVAKDRCRVSVIGPYYRMDDEHEFPLMNATPLLWRMVLYSSRGRLPAGTDLTAPVDLQNWPNMTRMAPIAHAMRIAALWATHPCSLLETARILGIPQRYVFAFYSAAHAIGSVRIMQGTGPNRVAVSSKQASKKRGILSRILARIQQARTS
jgi:hypothetical protein